MDEHVKARTELMVEASRSEVRVDRDFVARMVHAKVALSHINDGGSCVTLGER